MRGHFAVFLEMTHLSAIILVLKEYALPGGRR